MYESILFPSAGISHNYANWIVQTDDGQLLNGLLISESDTEVVLRNAEGILQRIPVDSIEEKKQSDLSLMPEGLHKEMSQQELVDLIDYLLLLKKP